MGLRGGERQQRDPQEDEDEFSGFIPSLIWTLRMSTSVERTTFCSRSNFRPAER